MLRLYSSVSLFTTFLTKGITTKDVGKATVKPIRKPTAHIRKKLGTKPTFIIVMVKDIVKDMAVDINAPNSTMEYFLSIFMITPASWKV